MDIIKTYVTRTLPKYLQSLPLPSNVDGLFKLTGFYNIVLTLIYTTNKSKVRY